MAAAVNGLITVGGTGCTGQPLCEDPRLDLDGREMGITLFIGFQLAEAVFRNGQDDIHGTSIRWRFVLESEVDGRTCRLFFDRTRDGQTIYPVTCFPIS